MARANVRQHVVPKFYLDYFTDVRGNAQAQNISTGSIFAADPTNLCVEKDVYTLLHEGPRDDSCDRINNAVEENLAPLFRRLGPGIDLGDEAMRREVFTLLAAFTANLIARSRVLRNHLNGSLDRVNEFLTAHPNFFDDFPEDAYQAFLADPGIPT